MRNIFARGSAFFVIVVALYGCMSQRTDEIDEMGENEGLAQEEATTQEIVARPLFACVQPIQTGPCRAYLQRYAFDPASGRCVPFIYGGCGGNANNFESFAACQYRCGRFPAPGRRP